MARPKKPDVVGVKIRLAASLVAKLEAAAKKRNHSFNHECARRLGLSFSEEELFGGETGRQVLYFLASAFVLAGSRAAGDRDINLWIKEPKAYATAMFAVLEALLTAQPPGVSLETCAIQIESMKGRVATRRLGKELAP